MTLQLFSGLQWICSRDDILASSADGDPGFVLGRRHQLRSDLHDLSLQLVKLQLPHQRAEQDRSDSVGEPVRKIIDQKQLMCRLQKHKGPHFFFLWGINVSLPQLWTCLISWETEQTEALLGRIFLKSIWVKPEGWHHNHHVKKRTRQYFQREDTLGCSHTVITIYIYSVCCSVSYFVINCFSLCFFRSGRWTCCCKTCMWVFRVITKPAQEIFQYKLCLSMFHSEVKLEAFFTFSHRCCQLVQDLNCKPSGSYFCCPIIYADFKLIDEKAKILNACEANLYGELQVSESCSTTPKA